jgi:hypothetical protein
MTNYEKQSVSKEYVLKSRNSYAILGTVID